MIFKKCRRQNPNEILYIIGNGFDLSHGIESSYSDFRRWFEGEYGRDVSLLDSFFSVKRNFWSDVEVALGEYDPGEIVEYCGPDEEFDMDHPTRSQAAIEDGPDTFFEPVLNELFEGFQEWVNNIDISKTQIRLQLNEKSLYFSFNYTETLEDFYGIPSSQILHIHGCRKNGDSCIMGHNHNRDKVLHDEDGGDYYFETDTRNKVISLMNNRYKDVESIAGRNRSFFDGLTGIKKIVVLGCSYNQVDFPYFEKIASKVSANACWVLNYHNDDDKEKAIGYAKQLNLKRVSYVEV